ncbi:MAG: hypothetical protein KatS3mg061_1798 [Dehalococcoidia bacterium]|nr:MAG: hypothetical protein KatS3mg061_1798 [Dehalococcoidia bacterium]
MQPLANRFSLLLLCPALRTLKRCVSPSAASGYPNMPSHPPPPPDPAAVLTARQRLEAATQRLLELERELARLRAEAAELRRQVEQENPGTPQPAPPNPSAEEVIVQPSVTGRIFSAIFRRGDPNAPAREYRGSVELLLRPGASVSAVRAFERALSNLPGVSIRFVWGDPQEGTTIGVNLAQPLALAALLRALPLVAEVRELSDRDEVGRLRVRLVEE